MIRINHWKRKVWLIIVAIIYIRLSFYLISNGIWWLSLLIPAFIFLGGFACMLWIFAEANKAHYPPDLFVDEIILDEK